MRDSRNGMTIPPTLTLRTVLDAVPHPKWWFDLLTTEPLALPEPVPSEPAAPRGVAWDGTAAWCRDCERTDCAHARQGTRAIRKPAMAQTLNVNAIISALSR